MTENNKKTGFVSLIGRPSSGKSTLVNTICGYKISIVSNKPQTTQFIVRGIYNDEESQIIFIDTPGFHKFDADLNRGLSKLAVRTLNDGDLVLYIVDTTREFGDEENEIIEHLKKIDKKIIIAFNKNDQNEVPYVKDEILKRLNIKDHISISAFTGDNIDDLLNIIKKNLNFGPIYYPKEYVTDQSIPFRIKEIVREKVFNSTGDEIPHSTYIEINKLDVKKEKIIAKATIYIERESQKGMVIGRNGKMIKKIGESSRKDLEMIFERRVDLFLKVDVDKKWRKNKKFLKKKYDIL